MRDDYDGGKSELSLGTSQDDDIAPGGGAEKSPQRELTNEYIQAVFARDSGEGLRLLHEHRRLIIMNANYLGGRRCLTYQEVEDAYQETLLDVYESSLDPLITIRQIVSYACSIADKRGKDMLRGKIRRERRVRLDDQKVENAPGQTDGQAEQKEWLATRNHLNSLKGDEKIVADCRFGDPQMTIEETAKFIGKSVSTVKRIQDKIYQSTANQLFHIRN